MDAILRRFVAGWFAAGASSLLVIASGCSAFGGRDRAMKDYEAARKQIGTGAAGEVRAVSYEEEEPDPSRPLEWEDFSPSNVGATWKRILGQGPSAAVARQHFSAAQLDYERASALREQGQAKESTEKFLAAAEQFEEAAERWPKSSLAQDARFMAGESYFFADHYPRAEEAYELLLKDFSHSRYLDRVQPRRFAIAEFWLELHRQDPAAFYEWNLTDKTKPLRDAHGHAIRIYDRIRLDDPTGKLADDATLAAANAYFANGDFLRADQYYADLRVTFPSSEFQYHAHLLGLKSKLLNYRGADYSSVPLDEAEKLFGQLRKQFPHQIHEDAEYLARAGAEIRYKQAERVWKRGQRNDMRAEYGAARFYYRNLLEQYADTPFADKARTRINELSGQPDVPPERFGWLTNLFPDEDTAQPLLTGDSVIRR